MLKCLFVLLVLEAHYTCYGDTSESNWSRRGFYRPLRNYPGQSQSPNAVRTRDAGYRQDSESQEPVGHSFSQSLTSFGSEKSQNSLSTGASFGQKFQSQNSNYNQSSDRQNSFQTNHRQNSQNENLFKIRHSQNYQNRNTFDGRHNESLLENANNSNSQNRNSFGTGISQNNQNESAIAAKYRPKRQTRNSFGSYTQNAQNHNEFETTYSQNTQRQNTIGSSIGQNLKSDNPNIDSSSSSFALPRGQSIHKGPEYVPPNDTGHGGFGRYLSGDNEMGDNNRQWPYKTGLKDEGLEHHQSNTVPDIGKIGQDGNVASKTADQLVNPFKLNDQDSGSDLQATGEPAEAEKIEQDATLPSQIANPVLNPTIESNKSLSQAFITSPNFPYTSQDNVTSTQSERGTIQPNTPEAPQPASVKSSDKGITINLTESTPPFNIPPHIYKYPIPPPRKPPPPPPRPATVAGPAPGIGFMPVPVQEQFSAPALQWYVGIYTKTQSPYLQICGGSLVKTDVVLTVAHCFWGEEGALPPALYAAAAGKLQRAWNASSDASAQTSDIRELHIPPRYGGRDANFQDDIAIARLSTPFEYAPGVKPVCVDFDLALEREQLQKGSQGTVAGFGLTEENGNPSEVLNYQRLPYVEISDCINASHPVFRKYLTSDKICAGDQRTGIALCRGDSGGGLVFFSGEIDKAVIYLRGLASVAPRNNNECNAQAIGSFTHVRSHRTFLRDHIPGLEEECRMVYAEELGFELKTITGPGKNKPEEDLSSGEPQAKTLGRPMQLGQTKPNVNQPNDTPSENGMQTGIDVIANLDRQQEPNEPSVINVNPLEALVKPSVSNPNGDNQKPNIGVISEEKVKGNQNNIILNHVFFTSPLVAPSKLLGQTNATPAFVDGRLEQPINIFYVFIQN